MLAHEKKDYYSPIFAFPAHAKKIIASQFFASARPALLRDSRIAW